MNIAKPIRKYLQLKCLIARYFGESTRLVDEIESVEAVRTAYLYEPNSATANCFKKWMVPKDEMFGESLSLSFPKFGTAVNIQ